MEKANSCGIYKARHHNGSYLLLLGKTKLVRKYEVLKTSYE